ncbi:MAG: hypothetical protein ACPGVN_02645 [Alphaproteobacteria bacterium]
MPTNALRVPHPANATLPKGQYLIVLQNKNGIDKKNEMNMASVGVAKPLYVANAVANQNTQPRMR